MEDKRKIKILDILYDEKLKLVQWKILDFKTQSQQILAWRGRDLGEALGIKQIIPPDLMQKFCKDMIGKELTIIFKSNMIQYMSDSFKDITEEELQNMSNKLEREYPFYEIEYLEKQERKDHDDDKS